MVHLILGTAVLLSLGERKRREWLLISCCLLFAFAALRWQYGNDYENYRQVFQSLVAGEPSPYRELGFGLLMKLCPSFFSFQALTSLILVGTAWAITTCWAPRGYGWVGFSLFVLNPYLFLMNLSAIRQSIALCLFVAAVALGLKRKFLGFCLCIGLAGCFHTSALFLLPVYFLLGKRDAKQGEICLLLLGLALLLAVDFESPICEMLEKLELWEYAAYVRAGRTNSLRATVLTGILFCYVLGNLPKLRDRDAVLGRLYLLGLALGLLAFRLSLLTRVQMYFDIFALAVVPSILEKNRGPLELFPGRPLINFGRILDRYAFPTLVFLIFALRYYAFFTNPMWESFSRYQTIFTPLLGG